MLIIQRDTNSLGDMYTSISIYVNESGKELLQHKRKKFIDGGEKKKTQKIEEI